MIDPAANTDVGLSQVANGQYAVAEFHGDRAQPTSLAKKPRSWTLLVSLLGHVVLFSGLAILRHAVPISTGEAPFASHLTADFSGPAAGNHAADENSVSTPDVSPPLTELTEPTAETPRPMRNTRLPSVSSIEPLVGTGTLFPATAVTDDLIEELRAHSATPRTSSSTVMQTSYHEPDTTPGTAAASPSTRPGDGDAPWRQVASPQGGTVFFGIPTVPRSVAYVVDCSESMTGLAFALAAEEVRASVRRLPITALFQVIAFSDRPALLVTDGAAAKLVPNVERHRHRLDRALIGIQPSGGSNRLAALLAAIALRPDACYVLTDSAEPWMTSAELDRLRQANAGRCRVHVVEFGDHPATEATFLRQLAIQHRGEYRRIAVPGRSD